MSDNNASDVLTDEEDSYRRSLLYQKAEDEIIDESGDESVEENSEFTNQSEHESTSTDSQVIPVSKKRSRRLNLSDTILESDVQATTLKSPHSKSNSDLEASAYISSAEECVSDSDNSLEDVDNSHNIKNDSDDVDENSECVQRQKIKRNRINIITSDDDENEDDSNELRKDNGIRHLNLSHTILDSDLQATALKSPHSESNSDLEASVHISSAKECVSGSDNNLENIDNLHNIKNDSDDIDENSESIQPQKIKSLQYVNGDNTSVTGKSNNISANQDSTLAIDQNNIRLVEIDQSSNDPLEFSTKMKSDRISQQFKFDTEGILNSTSVHTTDQPQVKWRPSINFHDIEENSVGTSVEVLSDDSDDVIEVSSREYVSPTKIHVKRRKPEKVVRQQNLNDFVEKSALPKPLKEKQETVKPPMKMVSNSEYETQWIKVDNLKIEFDKLYKVIEHLNLETLPDKGKMIQGKLREAEKKYLEEDEKLKCMKVSEKSKQSPKEPLLGDVAARVPWADLQAGANAVQPKTFGKQAMSTYNAQKAVTLDRLQQLHGALETCPKEDEMEEDPIELKISLMPHQRRALAWLMFREKEKPSGGILADDMGLGKTLTMIALIVKILAIEKQNADSDEENNGYMGKKFKPNGGSLIICPASLLNQWSDEIDRRLKRGSISYNVYHGPKRESSAKRLAKYDVVITTYAIVNNECDKDSTLFRIKWRRIILDEAHQIRNYKSQTSEACCQLSSKSRWALTGTPMHNKELDMYAYLKFLRCTPFDDLQVWKRWVADKSRGGKDRLHTVISSLMLRRTKIELMEKGALKCMPEKEWQLIKVELDPNELQVYHKVLIFSQTLFAQFLHQRAEKNQQYELEREGYADLPRNAAVNQEYDKMRKKLLKLNKVKNVSQHEILVLLLRLRQICCHPSLITSMLQEGKEDIGSDDEECEELNILEQLNKLKIDDDEDEKHEDEYKPDAHDNKGAMDKVNLKEAAKGHLRPSDPIFAQDRASSKIKTMMKLLKEKVLMTKDKAIIVSQWSSYLNLISLHLKHYGVEFDQLDGKVPVHKRMDMVNRFNDPEDSIKILLLSLTAGGVGLNLVGANHLFLLDLHWNPQLENQAQDRIYRVGQQKAVFVYKFIVMNTIEERIKMLQDKKLEMAEGILTGTRQVVQNKLSMDDLKMLFEMNGT